MEIKILKEARFCFLAPHRSVTLTYRNIPEPTTCALLGLGVIGFLTRRRK